MKNFKTLLLLALCLCLTGMAYGQFDNITPTEDTRPTYPTHPQFENALDIDMQVPIMAAGYAGIKENKEIKQLKDKANGCGNISFDPIAVSLCAPTGSFIVNYSPGFSPEARRAFQYAVDIWSRVLNLSEPIIINANWTALGPGILGSAGPTFIWRDFAGAPIGSTWYPQALAKQFDVTAQSGHDINANFSSAFSNWYFGLDGCPPAGEFDFVTVVLHEIGHGLGFLSSGQPLGFLDAGCFGFGAFPYIFDLFLFNNAYGFDLATLNAFLGTGCFIGLEDFFTNGDLVFTGPETQACIGGPAPIYAPDPYRPGSSISHFDEASFPGVDPNALMTPSVAPGEAVHDPGCALALLRDLGYDAVDDVPECEVVPTMGEWGLMSLGLLLLILGVVTIKSRKLITG